MNRLATHIASSFGDEGQVWTGGAEGLLVTSDNQPACQEEGDVSAEGPRHLPLVILGDFNCECVCHARMLPCNGCGQV
jgi:hypothetical protein